MLSVIRSRDVHRHFSLGRERVDRPKGTGVLEVGIKHILAFFEGDVEGGRCGSSSGSEG